MKINFFLKHYIFWKIIVFVFHLIFMLSSTSQSCYSQAGSSLGVKAGAGYSRYFFVVSAVQEPINQNFVPVFQTGLVFSQVNSKNMGVQIELNYIQKAWEETIGESGKYKVVLNNVELPFLSHFRIGKRKTGWIINMGFHLSYAFNANIDSSGLSTQTPLINYSALEYSKFDYGLDGGIGYEIGKEKGIFLIQLMFSQGMKNIVERDPSAVYRSLNQSLFLSLIYKIPLSHSK